MRLLSDAMESHDHLRETSPLSRAAMPLKYKSCALRPHFSRTNGELISYVRPISILEGRLRLWLASGKRGILRFETTRDKGNATTGNKIDLRHDCTKPGTLGRVHQSRWDLQVKTSQLPDRGLNDNEIILHSIFLQLWESNRPDFLICNFYVTCSQSEDQVMCILENTIHVLRQCLYLFSIEELVTCCRCTLRYTHPPTHPPPPPISGPRGFSHEKHDCKTFDNWCPSDICVVSVLNKNNDSLRYRRQKCSEPPFLNFKNF